MQLQSLLTALEQAPIRIWHNDSLKIDSDIVNLAYDSRKVEAGGLFIAVPGVHTDGRLFLHDAVRRGASAAIGEPLQETLDIPLPYIEVHDVRTALANHG